MPTANRPPTRIWSFDAGATADMLVVAYSGEIGNTVTGHTIKISYAGTAMTRALGGLNAAIFYLDLSTTTYTGGAADLVVDLRVAGRENRFPPFLETILLRPVYLLPGCLFFLRYSRHRSSRR